MPWSVFDDAPDVGRRDRMKIRAYRFAALCCCGAVLGFLPGCVEVYLLNIATPFLFAN
jgi:hypothetical protein